MRLFVLSRHAESVLNHENRINGDPTVPAPLTEGGREEAAWLGLQVRSIPLDGCLHTRFGRTLETARIGIEGRDVPLAEEELFDDVRVGELEGWTLEEYRAWKRERGPVPLRRERAGSGCGRHRAARYGSVRNSFAALTWRPGCGPPPIV